MLSVDSLRARQLTWNPATEYQTFAAALERGPTWLRAHADSLAIISGFPCTLISGTASAASAELACSSARQPSASIARWLLGVTRAELQRATTTRGWREITEPGLDTLECLSNDATGDRDTAQHSADVAYVRVCFHLSASDATVVVRARSRAPGKRPE